MALLAGFGMICCSPPDRHEKRTARRDSGGVSIVESYSPQWSDETEWKVSSEPLLSLGAGSRDPRYSFTRVVGARVIQDSLMVVADRSLAQVRFYSIQGRFVGAVGGRGAGPGEFQDIQNVGPAGGDTTWVFDRRLQRITLITAPHEPAHVVRLDPPGRTEIVGRLPDGGWLIVQLFTLPDLASESGPGVHRDHGFLLRYDRSGRLADTLAAVPTLDILHLVENGTLRRWGPPVVGHQLSVAMGNAGFFVGTQEQFEVREYKPDGQLQRLIRLPDAEMPLGAQVLDAALNRRLRRTDDDSRKQRRAFLADLPRRDTAPAFESFIVDTDGNLWVSSRDYSAPGRMRSGPDWKVFDPSGSWLGTVSMPTHFQPLDIGEDWIMGFYVDETNVQHIRLYSLEK